MIDSAFPCSVLGFVQSTLLLQQSFAAVQQICLCYAQTVLNFLHGNGANINTDVDEATEAAKVATLSDRLPSSGKAKHQLGVQTL